MTWNGQNQWRVLHVLCIRRPLNSDVMPFNFANMHGIILLPASVLCVGGPYHSCSYSNNGDEEKWHQHIADCHISIDDGRGLSSAVHCICSGEGGLGCVEGGCPFRGLYKQLAAPCCFRIILVVHVTPTWFPVPFLISGESAGSKAWEECAHGNDSACQATTSRLISSK